jgi:hypothetical protein
MVYTESAAVSEHKPGAFHLCIEGFGLIHELQSSLYQNPYLAPRARNFKTHPLYITACNSASAHSPPTARSPQSVTLCVPVGYGMHYTVLLRLRLWTLGYQIRRNLIESLVIKGDPLSSEAPGIPTSLLSY